MIIEGAAYRAGVCTMRGIGIDAAADLLGVDADADVAAASPDAFVWIGLRMPTRDEIDTATQRLGLSPYLLRDALDVHERPKLEREGDVLLVVLRTARYLPTLNLLESGEVVAVLRRDLLVTVRHGQASPLGEVRARLEAQPTMLARGPAMALHAVVEQVVADYRLVVDRLIREVRDVEHDVFSERRGQPIRRIYFLIRQVLDFLTAISPLTGPLEQLAGPACASWVPDDVAPLFDDARDDVLRVLEDARTLETLLISALNASQTEIALRQNEDMRRISAWVAIAAVPTLVAGIYGMNFDHMPELELRYGYHAVVVGLIVVCGALYRRFRSSGWL